MQQHIGNSIGGSPHECPLDAFRSCLLGRMTGKPEVDKLAWRHLTLICNSPDLTLHTWLSETVGTVYCYIRVSLRVARSFYFCNSLWPRPSPLRLVSRSATSNHPLS